MRSVWKRTLAATFLVASATIPLAALVCATPGYAQSSPGSETYLEMREAALAMRPEDIGLTDLEAAEVYGVVVDIDLDGTTVTIIAFATGDASLYFSSGGGVIGGIEHASVRTAAQALVDTTSRSIDHFSPTSRQPLPGAGEVRIYALRPDGLLAADGQVDVMVLGGHELSKVFFAANDVITALRVATQP